MPPWRRLETRGLPSLSMPPDTVRPRVVPSFLISSTVLVPLNSSVKHREGWGGGSLGEVGEEEQRQEMRGLQEQRMPAAAIPHSPLTDCDQVSQTGPLSHALYLTLSLCRSTLAGNKLYTLECSVCVCVCVSTLSNRSRTQTSPGALKRTKPSLTTPAWENPHLEKIQFSK